MCQLAEYPCASGHAKIATDLNGQICYSYRAGPHIVTLRPASDKTFIFCHYEKSVSIVEATFFDESRLKVELFFLFHARLLAKNSKLKAGNDVINISSSSV
jgi:hypothetical protein